LIADARDLLHKNIREKKWYDKDKDAQKKEMIMIRLISDYKLFPINEGLSKKKYKERVFFNTKEELLNNKMYEKEVKSRHKASKTLFKKQPDSPFKTDQYLESLQPPKKEALKTQ